MKTGASPNLEKGLHKLEAMFHSLPASISWFRELYRVINLHGECIDNTNPTLQLVTLWTTFETLVPIEGSESKISEIIQAFIPCIKMSYYGRKIDALCRNILNWDSGFCEKIQVDPWKFRAFVATALASGENSYSFSQINATLENNPLLQYRLFQMSREINTSNNYKSKIEEHAQKVSWQIRRIYRARNKFIHSGSPILYLDSLTANGHEYFDSVMDCVTIIANKEYRLTSFSDALTSLSIICDEIIRNVDGERKPLSWKNIDSMLDYSYCEKESNERLQPKVTEIMQLSFSPNTI